MKSKRKSYTETLKQCVKIGEERQLSYGYAQDSIKLVSDILDTTFGLKLSPIDVCKVMVALKLSRLKFKFGPDHLIDSINYIAILNSLLEES